MPPGPKKGPNKDSLKWIVDKHMLTRREVTKIFSGYHRFLFQERPLVREEIFGIVAIMLGKKTVSPLTPNVLNGMLDIFDDPNHPYTIEHAKLYEEDAPNLDTAVDESYQTLCEDPLAIDRRAILNGLTIRLPYIRRPHWPLWAKRWIRLDQNFLLYAIANWCKDHEGNSMGENNRGKTFITKMVFHGVESISKILIQLVDADNELTMEVAGLIYSDRMFVDHFGNLAHKMHVQHTRGLGLPPPLLVLPDTSQSDLDLATTTTSFAAMTIEATASGPFQPIASDSREPTPFAEFTNYDRYVESEPTEESSEKDPKGKGKARQRESSSKSPEGEGTEAAKRPGKKEPRRGGKQRESGAAYRERLPQFQYEKPDKDDTGGTEI